MVLTMGDDYPLHQLPVPVAQTTGERNFYDRYFFNGYAPDGDGFFAVAFGIYPQLGIADAHFSCLRAGTQHCLHASRELGDERMELTVGPITIEIVEPLRRLRVEIVRTDGIAASLEFTGRAPPIEEPRFTYRQGSRLVMDYTRMTQNCAIEGWWSVDGQRHEFAEGARGTRDRSWGIRPVGLADPQPAPRVRMPQFFWQWTPLNFAHRSIFFHRNADGDGTPWNTRAVVVPDGRAGGKPIEIDEPVMKTTLAPGSRWPDTSTLVLPRGAGEGRYQLKPVARFQMRGLGYTSPDWGHGHYKGPLEVAREDFALAECDPAEPSNLHVQMPSRVTGPDGEEGFGVFEQLAIGPYAPMGLAGLADPPS